MDSRLSKPRVFLSHSKSDSVFVERLDADLRVCQIETWLDTVDIPHGRPWLDAIFEDGIPGCDAVMVYLTTSSIESPMVKKEIDAAILQQLKDRRVAFLPYVSSSDLRANLRADIQALQSPEWNDANYSEVLPRVVAEIWRSYLERTVAAAVQDEKVRRLEVELNLESLRAQSVDSVFSPAEEAEFSYIWSALARYETVGVEKLQRRDGGRWEQVGTYEVPVLIATLVAFAIAAGYEYSWGQNNAVLEVPVSDFLSTREAALGDLERFHVTSTPSLSDELTMFGLLDRVQQTQSADDSPLLRRSVVWGGPPYWNVWTAKSQRLRYWLAYNKRLPQTVEFGDDVQQSPPMQ